MRAYSAPPLVPGVAFSTRRLLLEADTSGTWNALLSLRGGAAQAGLMSSVASLTKNLMGVGVLTIAAGMAAGTGVGPATLAMLAWTLVAAYSFSLLGDACEATGLGTACSFERLWSITIGPRSVWLMHAAIGSLTFAILAVYLICLGELLPPLLELFHAPRALRSRRGAVALAAAATFPLCLARSLAGLEFSSYLGMVAIAYTALFSLVRCFDGSYRRGGAFYDRIAGGLRPSFENTSTWLVSRKTAVLLANLGVALCVHFNAPSFYRSLEAASASRFRLMTYGAFGLVFVLSLCIALPGYMTFGSASQPLILTNYHSTDDGLATAARIATAASLSCSFPLVFAALRESCLAALGAATSGAAWWSVTLLLPALALALALLVDDLGLVVGLLGSILGGAIMYVAPPAIHAVQLSRSSSSGPSRTLLLAADIALIVLGIAGQMIAGTVVTYNTATARRGK